jgi:mono/diheme cytochrome c family protein
MAFVKKHTKFFMLLTMVFGGLTGVAIWFVISIVHPAATSMLIHTFVFGWATEWVFFVVEIVALFIYFYTFGHMDDRTHQMIGWVYFFAAWMSLFLITGIIDFMLTPGAWLADANFWSGFFNPTFWPSVFFRSFISFMLAGCYALLTASFLDDETSRHKIVRYSGYWALISLILSIPAGWWYIAVLPDRARQLVEGASPTIARAATVGALSMAALAGAVIILILLKPKIRTKALATIVMIAAMGYMGAFEWSREAARRPYVVNEVMYSNGILKKEVERINEEGFLKNAKWVQNKEITEANRLDAGRELFIHQCYACHTQGGFNNDIIVRTSTMSYGAMRKYLATLHEKRYFMPPFAGAEDELRALAAYLTAGLHNKPLAEDAALPAGGGGQALFADNCASCHGMGVLKPLMAGWNRQKIRSSLDKLSALNPGMPDYEGSPAEKELMTDYLLKETGGAK